jgi:ATP-dependent Clp protease ATP-binding subunit ClpA
VGYSSVLKNAMSAGQTRQNSAQSAVYGLINEHFEPNFTAVWPSTIVFSYKSSNKFNRVVKKSGNQ